MANVHYGVADILIGSTDVGYTAEGVTITPEASMTDLVVNEEVQVIDRMMTSFVYVITFTMAETTAANFIGYATGSSSGTLNGTLKKLATTLTITATDQSAATHTWTFKAGTVESGAIQYTKGQGWGIPITVKTLKGATEHTIA
jgi:hypothetical protein